MTRRNRRVVGRATDRRDDRLVQQHMSTDRASSQGTKFLAATPLAVSIARRVESGRGL